MDLPHYAAKEIDDCGARLLFALPCIWLLLWALCQPRIVGFIVSFLH
jgi:hypothetical protein